MNKFPLVYFGRRRQEIAKIEKVDEAKDIHDKGEALRLYARKSGKGVRVVCGDSDQGGVSGWADSGWHGQSRGAR